MWRKVFSIRAQLTALVCMFLFLDAFAFSTAYADAPSDFSREVERAEKVGSRDTTVLQAQSELSNAEYTSSWDEFGTSPLIDGAGSSADITAAIVDDISNTVSAEQHFDNTEVKYLEAVGATPEQIVSLENRNGSDVPPGETIEPNPSLAENPDANATVAEDVAAEAVAEASVEPSAPGGNESGSIETGNVGEQAAFEAVVTGDPGYVGAGTGDAPTGGESGNEAAPSDEHAVPTDQTESSGVNLQGFDAPTGVTPAQSDANASGNSSIEQAAPVSNTASGADTGSDAQSGASDANGTDSSSTDGSSPDSGAPSGGDSGGAADSSSASVISAWRHIAPDFKQILEPFFMLFRIHP